MERTTQHRRRIDDWLAALVLLVTWLPGSLVALDLAPVPEPSLDAAEAGLRQHIESAREALDGLPADAPAGERAAAYGELGSLYLLSELRAAAEAALRNAHALDPSESRWPHLLGIVRLDVGDRDGAVEALRAALALRPGHAPLRLRLADALRIAGSFDEARDLFVSALAEGLPPQNEAFARYGLGRIAVAEGRWQEAVQHLESARELAPGASAVRRVLGLAYREVGRLDDARRDLAAGGTEEVGLDDPWVAELLRLDTGAYLSKAVSARVAGDLERAEELYRQAVAADPRSADAVVGLAEVLFVRGDRAGSVEAAERAAEAAPGRADVHAKLGDLLTLAGRPADAVAPYRKALELAPEAPAAHMGLGRALAMTGRHEQALEHYDRSLAARPDDLETLALRARALVRLGRHAEAAASLGRALDLDPGSVRVRLAHAEALARAGDAAAVRKSLEAGVAATDDPRLVATLIQALIGDPDATRRDPQRAVALGAELLRRDPSVSHAVILARALFAAGRVGEAVQLQQRALDEARSAGAPEQELAPLTQALELYRSRLEAGSDP